MSSQNISVAVGKARMHFREPFKIAYEEVETSDVVLLRLSGPDGLSGLGSSAPDPEVTKESADTTHDLLEKELREDFFSLPLDNWYGYHEKIQRVFAGSPASQAIVEEAFLNLWCAQHATTIRLLFGGYREMCPIMMTIGIKGPQETVDEAHRRQNEGYSTIKLKCGLDVEEDIEKIRRVVQVLDPKTRLVLDANQGYSLADARKLLTSLKGAPITLIEQPVAAEDVEGMRELHHMRSIPVIADEAAVSVDDALSLLMSDSVAGVNIKLVKCGGPMNFAKIFHIAKALRKTVMIGCMYESNISITTGAHMALALPVGYVDLDSGHLDFPDDPGQGGAIVENGNIRISSPLSTDFFKAQ